MKELRQGFRFQIEDKVLRSYTSGDFSCFEGV